MQSSGDNTQDAEAPAAGGISPSERTFWIVFGTLAAAGMVGGLVLLGMFLLIIPGFVLLLAPAAFLYGGAGRWLVLRWRSTRSRSATLRLALVFLTIALAPPLIVNARQAAHEVLLRRTDFMRLPPGTPRPRVLHLGAMRIAECDDVCKTILVQGLADVVVGPPETSSGEGAPAYRLGDAKACAGLGGLSADEARPCVLRSAILQPHADTRLNLRRRDDHLPSGARSWVRLNPLALGHWSASTLELELCAPDGRCRLVARQTATQHERLIPPLIMATDHTDYGLEINRAWARYEHTAGKADAVALLTSLWPGRGGSARGVEVVADIAALASLPNPAIDRRGLSEALSQIGATTGPLSGAEAMLLRKVWASEDWSKLPTGWLARREAIHLTLDRADQAFQSAAASGEAVPMWAQSVAANVDVDDFDRLRPVLRTWIGSHSAAIVNYEPQFLLRLADLGAAILPSYVQVLSIRPDRGYSELRSPEIAVRIAALCLLGAGARSTIPLLETHSAEIRVDYAPRADTIDEAIRRIRDGGSSDACLTSDADVWGDSKWLRRFADERGLTYPDERFKPRRRTRTSP